MNADRVYSFPEYKQPSTGFVTVDRYFFPINGLSLCRRNNQPGLVCGNRVYLGYECQFVQPATLLLSKSRWPSWTDWPSLIVRTVTVDAK